jgi:hypothetical protein
MHQGRFSSKPIHLKLGPNGLNFQRADVLIHGVDQSGESFEGRVFLNNPDANIETPTDPEHGYAGSFSVYGYGLWPGNPDNSTAESNTVSAPIEKDVIATEAVRAAAVQGSDVVVTIVPVFLRDPVLDAGKAMRLEDVSIEIRP